MKGVKKLKRSTHLYCIHCNISIEDYSNHLCWKCGNKENFTYNNFITSSVTAKEIPLWGSAKAVTPKC